MPGLLGAWPHQLLVAWRTAGNGKDMPERAARPPEASHMCREVVGMTGMHSAVPSPGPH